ncbi:MAG: hypothetical protein ACM3Y8_06470 [Byssovorax cruenta]
MSDMDFEAQLRSIAGGMNYPRTPNIAGSVTALLRSANRPRPVSRTLVWSLTILLILISSLMLIPPARAAILEFIQIGVVRIFRAEPTPLPAPNQEPPAQMVPVTATPVPTSQPLIPILRNLSGEVTLEEAQKQTKDYYPILLPSYPPDLGQPDYVFVQDADGAMTVLVWADPHNPDEVLMSLHFLPSGSWAIKKMEPTVIEETSVNGQQAIWTTGPYPIRVQNGDIQFTRMIDGHVLIWEGANVTYRLETDLPLDEAVKVAESLHRASSP